MKPLELQYNNEPFFKGSEGTEQEKLFCVEYYHPMSHVVQIVARFLKTHVNIFQTRIQICNRILPELRRTWIILFEWDENQFQFYINPLGIHHHRSRREKQLVAVSFQ